MLFPWREATLPGLSLGSAHGTVHGHFRQHLQRTSVFGPVKVYGGEGGGGGGEKGEMCKLNNTHSDVFYPCMHSFILNNNNNIRHYRP